jgi:hypothetical protein
MAYTTQYIGSRYVPIFADPTEWDSTRTYEPLTIVLNEGNSYTSRQFVPVNVTLTNTDYWLETGNYNAQLEQYRRTALQRNFETVEAMTNANYLALGNIANTLGYHTSDDGGAASYIITQDGTADGYSVIALDNGLYANLVYTGNWTFEMFGAYGDGTHDDTSAITTALEYIEALTSDITIQEIQGYGTYFHNGFTVHPNRISIIHATFLNNSNPIVINASNEQAGLYRDIAGLSQCTINNISSNSSHTGIEFGSNAGKAMLDRCVINNFNIGVYFSNGGYASEISGCQIRGCVTCIEYDNGSDAGELNKIKNSTIFNSTNGVVINKACTLSVINSSFDYLAKAFSISQNNTAITCINNHFETNKDDIYFYATVPNIFWNMHGCTFYDAATLTNTLFNNGTIVFNSCIFNRVTRPYITSGNIPYIANHNYLPSQHILDNTSATPYEARNYANIVTLTASNNASVYISNNHNRVFVHVTNSSTEGTVRIQFVYKQKTLIRESIENISKIEANTFTYNTGACILPSDAFIIATSLQSSTEAIPNIYSQIEYSYLEIAISNMAANQIVTFELVPQIYM